MRANCVVRTYFITRGSIGSGRIIGELALGALAAAAGADDAPTFELEPNNSSVADARRGDGAGSPGDGARVPTPGMTM